MPKVSGKRQITLPISLCEEAHIAPGDEVEAFVYRGQITVVRKESGAAHGALAHLRAKAHVSDEESLQSTVGES